MAVNWEAYSLEFTGAAKKAGRDDESIARSLAYAHRLWTARLPIIFDETHLALLLGFSPERLTQALYGDKKKLYVTTHIPKRLGGYRRIDSPVPSLKSCQTWILRNILDRIPSHSAATAFCIGVSIRDNAGPHVAAAMILSLDVTDFFGSLRASKCLALFLEMGYSEHVAAMLASIVTYNDSLPQGGPSSPSMSNLLMRNFDIVMSQVAQFFNLRYTRYADDITISGVFQTGKLIAVCESLLAREGLFLNHQKTRLMLRHQRQEVTGVVVNSRLQAPRALRRYLRDQIHMISRFGTPRDILRDPHSIRRHRQHLRGIAEFVLFLNSEDRYAKEAITVLASAWTTSTAPDFQSRPDTSLPANRHRLDP
jgi:RNA-directed DNA polymerase